MLCDGRLRSATTAKLWLRRRKHTNNPYLTLLKELRTALANGACSAAAYSAHRATKAHEYSMPQTARHTPGMDRLASVALTRR